MSRFKDWKSPVIEHLKPTKWGWMVSYPEGLKLGYGVDIGAFTYIQAKAGVEIGDYAQIGGGCKIYSVDTIHEVEGKIVIGKNAKIGANSVILPNVIIGENSVIGALSLVKNAVIPRNEVWAGIPIRKIKKI